MPGANASLKNRLSVGLTAVFVACCFRLPSPFGAFGQAHSAPGSSIERWNQPVGGRGGWSRFCYPPRFLRQAGGSQFQWRSHAQAVEAAVGSGIGRQ